MARPLHQRAAMNAHRIPSLPSSLRSSTSPRRRTTALGVLTVTVFAALSVASGNSKSDAKGDASITSAAAANGASGGDPSKSGATLVGSCDRSDQFYKDCTESYAPLSSVADAKSSCQTLGGKFRLGGCPRINAISQCLEGNAPALSGSYGYEGTKTKHEAADCPRGFKDLKVNPELKPSATAASCNAIATGGVCVQFSAVTAETEISCLDVGGKLEVPAKPCPTANGLVAYKLQGKDGTTETNYVYSTPYTNAEGTHTWKTEDALLICGLAGSACSKVPFEPEGATGAAGATGNAAGAAGAAKAGAAKAPAKPAKK